MKSRSKDCKTCYRISCRKCGWIATEEDVLQIQCQILTSCPVCGWKPGENVD